MTTVSAIKASPGTDAEGRAEEPVLVFDANMAGRHGRGMSLLAEKCHGAVEGKGSGHHGNSYAIPSADADMVPLGSEVVANYIRGFLKFAAARPELLFRVTALGFGNPHLKATEIATMFRAAPTNCLLPGRWLEMLGQLDTARVIVLDAGGTLKHEHEQKALDEYFTLNAPLWKTRRVEIVSTGVALSVVANDQYARSRKYKHRIMSVNEGYYSNCINQAREELAAWYGTRMVCLIDPELTANANQLRMLQAATRAGLEIEDINIAGD